MLRERLTEARWIIWLHDPAIAAAHAAGLIQDTSIYDYVMSMDIKEFGGLEEIQKWPVPPILFKMAPMTTDLLSIEENDLSLFAFTCRDIKNAPTDWCVWTTRPDKTRYLEDDVVRKKIPLGCVRDLAEWVRQAATRDGDYLPFSSPVGWQSTLTRHLALAAIRARKEVALEKSEAKPTPSES